MLLPLLLNNLLGASDAPLYQSNVLLFDVPTKKRVWHQDDNVNVLNTLLAVQPGHVFRHVYAPNARRKRYGALDDQTVNLLSNTLSVDVVDLYRMPYMTPVRMRKYAQDTVTSGSRLVLDDVQVLRRMLMKLGK